MEQTPVIELRTKIQEDTVGKKSPSELFRSLNERGIRYCLWKSNIRQEEGMRGETDLDLLVDREHIAAFRQTLQAMSVVRPTAVAIVVGNLVNVAGNWALIFGHLGFPALGVKGAAYSTSAGRWVMLLCFLWAAREELSRYWRGFDREAFDSM